VASCRLTQAQSFCALAANPADPNHRLIGERMLGISHHYLGDQVTARRHLETVLDKHVESENRSHIVRFQVDLRVSARTFLAPVLWLLGLPDQAMCAAEAAVADARAITDCPYVTLSFSARAQPRCWRGISHPRTIASVMSGKEALNVPRRLEPLHDPLSSSGRLMGVSARLLRPLC
jgi:hypothetical protein